MKYFYMTIATLFQIGLAYYTKYSTSAVIAANILEAVSFFGILAMQNQNKKPISRSGLPAYIAFPVDILCATWAVYVGKWMVLYAVLMYIQAIVELKVFGDIPEWWDNENIS